MELQLYTGSMKLMKTIETYASDLYVLSFNSTSLTRIDMYDVEFVLFAFIILSSYNFISSDL